VCKIALFLPTYRPGGLDVFEASIQRQTIKPDVIFVADELHRTEGWLKVAESLKQKIYIVDAPKKLGDKRNLAAVYNEASRCSIDHKCDLFISLQDYIWIPENGIERFLNIYETEPNALITGVTHISEDPTREDIEDITASYTIFKKPFYEKPQKIAWYDVRQTELYSNSNYPVTPIYPEHWEANWAAIPTSMFERGMHWNKEYDRGIAYENADFAKQCEKETRCNILFNTKNEAISLPHKKYWPNEEKEIRKFSNRWLFESKWS
jgi:hypothetical protein